MIVQEHTLNDIGIAVDIGSTSIGVCCLDMIHKTEILSFSFTNPQHIYGADIITRIKHCIDEPFLLEEMRACVDNTLHNALRDKLGAQYSFISDIIYSGNTTMLHIMRGLSIQGLAYAPFQPVDLSYYKEIINGITYHYLPGFSAFVGADILAGVYYLQMGNKQSYDLLIDLGTNGEMLLINQDHGYATSTACGPVFDNVITGAKYGSESMRVIAQCVKRGLIDQSGKLTESLFHTGIRVDKNMIIKQEDIRNFQLAKGAIYAGVQCLCEQAHIEPVNINKVYVSGGLGFYMNIENAFTLRMLPSSLKSKITISGNTSLEGAKQFLLLDYEKVYEQEAYENIKKRIACFELANCEKFQTIYMQSLEF